MNVKIIIEGGGDVGADDASFRQGWACFFQNAKVPLRPRVVRGKGRPKALDLYKTACADRKADDVVLFLVDSEDLPAAGQSGWRH